MNRMPGLRFAFGPFILDPEKGTLLRKGLPVPVGYRSILLLGALLKNPGEVVTKSALICSTITVRTTSSGRATTRTLPALGRIQT